MARRRRISFAAAAAAAWPGPGRRNRAGQHPHARRGLAGARLASRRPPLCPASSRERRGLRIGVRAQRRTPAPPWKALADRTTQSRVPSAGMRGRRLSQPSVSVAEVTVHERARAGTAWIGSGPRAQPAYRALFPTRIAGHDRSDVLQVEIDSLLYFTPPAPHAETGQRPLCLRGRRR